MLCRPPQLDWSVLNGALIALGVVTAAKGVLSAVRIWCSAYTEVFKCLNKGRGPSFGVKGG